MATQSRAGIAPNRTLAHALLSRGYFPKELPPPFCTASFADAVLVNPTGNPPDLTFSSNRAHALDSKCGIYSLARPGVLRRPLSIANPVGYFHISWLLDMEWSFIQAHLARSTISASSPQVAVTGRAIATRYLYNHRPVLRSEVRAGAKYLVRTDINSFYPSIYTHSIPWALNTKPMAKQKRGYTDLVGNRLDALARKLQDGQTVGVPIGPDSSLIISECILTNVDEELLRGESSCRAFRYVDDYEICCQSYADAERILAKLQAILATFELALNPRKTDILQLPVPIEDAWVHELRRFQFDIPARSNRYELFHYFDRVFQRHREFPDSQIITYAICRSRAVVVEETSWKIYEALLLQCARVDPSSLQAVVEVLVAYHKAGFVIGSDKWLELFECIISENASLRHSSEVSWCLWAIMVLKLEVSQETAECLCAMQDPVVAIMTLHAHKLGLLVVANLPAIWESWLREEELMDVNWLFTYVALSQSLVQYPNGSAILAGSPAFEYLQRNGVAFYDENAANTWNPPPIGPRGGGGGGEY